MEEEEAGRVVGRTYRMEGGNRVDGTSGGERKKRNIDNRRIGGK